MASPTLAETHTMLKNEVDLLEELRKFAESNAKNFVGMEDTIVQSLETDFAVELTNAVAGARAGINGALAQATLETGQVGDGDFVTFTGDDGLDGGVPAPQVGAAQGTNAGNVHDAGFLVICGRRPVFSLLAPAGRAATAAWPDRAGRGRRS